MMEATANCPGTAVAQDYTCLVTYLIEVDHDVALWTPAALNVLQGQCKIDPPCVRDIEVVGVILVPFLNRCKHLILIRADDMHVLKKDTEK